MATKVEITGIESAEKRMRTFLNAAINDKELLTEIAQVGRDEIAKRTEARQEEYKQKDLKPLTIEARRILLDINGSTGFARAERSNLTLTGQLLNSISFKINQTKSQITYYLKDYRSKLQPLTKAERTQRYHQILDKDHNATNANRKDPKDKYRLSALFLTSKPQKEKTNTEIKRELEQRGFRFFFLSESLQAQLQNRIKQAFRRKLSNFKKLSKLLK